MIADIIVFLFLLILLCFSLVLFFGAPYLPTMNPQVATALKLADLKPGQTLLELGSGDGRVLIAAARSGLNAIGYELNPIMFLISWLRTRRYRSQVKLKFANFWHASWPPCDAIYVFLLPRLMDKLEAKIHSEGMKDAIVISFAFRFTKLKPIKEDHGVLLYSLK